MPILASTQNVCVFRVAKNYCTLFGAPFAGSRGHMPPTRRLWILVPVSDTKIQQRIIFGAGIWYQKNSVPVCMTNAPETDTNGR